jgi:hypothetical protein
MAGAGIEDKFARRANLGSERKNGTSHEQDFTRLRKLVNARQEGKVFIGEVGGPMDIWSRQTSGLIMRYLFRLAPEASRRGMVLVATLASRVTRDAYKVAQKMPELPPKEAALYCVLVSSELSDFCSAFAGQESYKKTYQALLSAIINMRGIAQNFAPPPVAWIAAPGPPPDPPEDPN